MLTPEEREEIINAAVEKALLMIPEVVGNMMTNHVAMAKINSDFYTKFPEFKNNKDIVMSVVEMIEGQNPAIDYEEILEKAAPEIRKRIATTDALDITNVSKNPSQDFSSCGDI